MNASMSDLLRVHDEPHTYVRESDVHAALTVSPRRYLDYLRRELVDIANGTAVVDTPSKQIFEDGESGGDFRVMPCVVRGPDNVRKTVKIVGTNAVGREVPDQVTVGKAFHLHPDENYLSHTFEACLLSSARTGACAALAVGHLAPATRRLDIVGAGRVGYYTALYVAALGGLESLVFHDRDAGRAKKMAAASFLGVPARHGTADELAQSTVVVVATTARAPVIGPCDVPTARLVVSVGADTSHQSELDPSWAKVADVATDSIDSFCVGDLRRWLDDGVISRSSVTTLLTELAFSPAPNADAGHRPRIYVSTGNALLDNLTIGFLLETS